MIAYFLHLSHSGRSSGTNAPPIVASSVEHSENVRLYDDASDSS